MGIIKKVHFSSSSTLIKFCSIGFNKTDTGSRVCGDYILKFRDWEKEEGEVREREEDIREHKGRPGGWS